MSHGTRWVAEAGRYPFASGYVQLRRSSHVKIIINNTIQLEINLKDKEKLISEFNNILFQPHPNPAYNRRSCKYGG
jgi:hypothetical protein